MGKHVSGKVGVSRLRSIIEETWDIFMAPVAYRNILEDICDLKCEGKATKIEAEWRRLLVLYKIYDNRVSLRHTQSSFC